MSNKYLRYEVARENAHYLRLVELARKELDANGVFERQDLIKQAALFPFEDAIRWDYVVRMIADETGNEMVPLAASYFKRHDKEHERDVPQQYIASGHGKRTVGYAAINPDNGHLAIAQLTRRQNVARGVIRSAGKTHATAAKAGVKKLPADLVVVDAPRKIEAG